MYLKSIASAFPEPCFTQQGVFAQLRETEKFVGLRAGSKQLLEKVLLRGGGISTRRFCMENLVELVESGAGDLNGLFESYGTELAVAALRTALDKAELNASELDALIVCTCTGYLCPGLTSHVAEQLGMRNDVFLQDVVGLGCGAAIPALRAAAGFLAMAAENKVAVIAVEVCSAAFYIDDDPGVLISLCLFGDGASASIWGGEQGTSRYRLDRFQTLHLPEHREKLRFENKYGFLRNRLHREVPRLAAEAVRRLFPEQNERVLKVVAHGGGKDVIEAVEGALQCSSLTETRMVLDRYGNLSSPSVMVALELALESSPESEGLWLTSFGAGFAAHSCELNLAN